MISKITKLLFINALTELLKLKEEGYIDEFQLKSNEVIIYSGSYQGDRFEGSTDIEDYPNIRNYILKIIKELKEIA